MAERPTLGSTYAVAGDGSLLSKGESLSCSREIQIAIIPHWRQAGLVDLKQAVLHWCTPLPWRLAVETRTAGETFDRSA